MEHDPSLNRLIKIDKQCDPQSIEIDGLNFYKHSLY